MFLSTYSPQPRPREVFTIPVLYKESDSSEFSIGIIEGMFVSPYNSCVET